MSTSKAPVKGEKGFENESKTAFKNRQKAWNEAQSKGIDTMVAPGTEKPKQETPGTEAPGTNGTEDTNKKPELSDSTVSKEGTVAKEETTAKPPKAKPSFQKGTLFALPDGRIELRKGIASSSKLSCLRHGQGILLVCLETIPKEKWVAYHFIGMTMETIEKMFPNLTMTPEESAKEYPHGLEFTPIISNTLKPYSEAKVVKAFLTIDPPDASKGHMGTLESISHLIGRKGVISYREVVNTPDGVVITEPTEKGTEETTDTNETPASETTETNETPASETTETTEGTETLEEETK